MNQRMRTIAVFTLGGLLALTVLGTAQASPPAAPGSFAQFDGTSSHIDVPDSPDLSVATTGALTVSAWIRPDTLTFPKTEGSGYVHWLGKGDAGQQEWTFRMYSQGNTENRGNRISFYVFNPNGGLGIGSHFEEPLTAGQWIHVVGVADHGKTAIYRDGVFKRCDQYQGNGDATCQKYPQNEWIAPQHGSAPTRMGTRDLRSFFQGGLAEVRVWNRALSAGEIASLYAQDQAPRNGLVAEYLLNERSGTVAQDTAGAHNGTLAAVTWGGGPTPPQPPPTPQTPPTPQATLTPTPGPNPAGDLVLSASPIVFTSGQTFNGVVASGIGTGGGEVNDYTATIDWGDGNLVVGNMTPGGPGSFQISGSNTFADVGPYTLTVTVTNNQTGAQEVVHTQATASTVSPPPSGGPETIAGTGQPIGFAPGLVFNGAVATFTVTNA
ncbi:MAG TPA: LamG domain-containing protein [Chloroflexota bacterium]|nr:LamG domain-containing protein [Chloroflexota bacterium]